MKKIHADEMKIKDFMELIAQKRGMSDQDLKKFTAVFEVE